MKFSQGKVKFRAGFREQSRGNQSSLQFSKDLRMPGMTEIVNVAHDFGLQILGSLLMSEFQEDSLQIFLGTVKIVNR
jgi:hypothetical protein